MANSNFDTSAFTVEEKTQEDIFGCDTGRKAQMDDRWAKSHDCCVECGTTDRPHNADGLCRRCYGRRRKRGIAERVKAERAAWRKQREEAKAEAKALAKAASVAPEDVRTPCNPHQVCIEVALQVLRVKMVATFDDGTVEVVWPLGYRERIDRSQILDSVAVAA